VQEDVALWQTILAQQRGLQQQGGGMGQQDVAEQSGRTASIMDNAAYRTEQLLHQTMAEQANAGERGGEPSLRAMVGQQMGEGQLNPQSGIHMGSGMTAGGAHELPPELMQQQLGQEVGIQPPIRPPDMVQAQMMRGGVQPASTNAAAVETLTGGSAVTGVEGEGGDSFANLTSQQQGVRGAGQQMGNGPQASGRPLPMHSPNFPDQLAERLGRVRMVTQPGQPQQMRVALHPQELGEMNVKIMVDDANRVQITITAESEAARDALMKQLPELKEALARQNLDASEMDVQLEQRDNSQFAAHDGSGDASSASDRESAHGFRGGGAGDGAEPDTNGGSQHAQPMGVTEQGVHLVA
jgi:flagellar hook-length control protein FliK